MDDIVEDERCGCMACRRRQGAALKAVEGISTAALESGAIRSLVDAMGPLMVWIRAVAALEPWVEMRHHDAAVKAMKELTTPEGSRDGA